MTCVVAVVDEHGGIHFGSDSLGSDGHTCTVLSDPKIFQNGEFLMGFSGNFRLGQLLRYSLTPPPRLEDQDTKEYLCTSFIDSVKQALAHGDYSIGPSLNDDEIDNVSSMRGDFLIGYRTQIFVIQSDFSLIHAVNDFAGIGSGSESANAVLYATRNLGLNPIDRLHMALDAAAYQINSVKPPFHFLSLPPEKEVATSKKTSSKPKIKI